MLRRFWNEEVRAFSLGDSLRTALVVNDPCSPPEQNTQALQGPPVQSADT